MSALRINGEIKSVDADPDMPVLWVLRDLLDMTGAKYGCGIGMCGACTVLIDGEPVRSCSVSVGETANSEITTIEGMDDDLARIVKAAWLETSALQCGYCQPGQIMTAIALLRKTPQPSDAEIKTAMDPILCRCGTYPRIRAAIKLASERL